MDEDGHDEIQKNLNREKIKSIAIPGAYLKTMSRVFKLIIDHLIGYK